MTIAHPLKQSICAQAWKHSDDECQWKGPFYFIQGADPQFGLMKAWTCGDTDNGDDEWGEEIKLAEQAVQAINKLNPKPKFFVLCGDLVHGMPGNLSQRFNVQTCTFAVAVQLIQPGALCRSQTALLVFDTSETNSLGHISVPELLGGWRFAAGTLWRKNQVQDLKNVLKNTDQDIPLVFVSGNHDVGNSPTRETIDDYCKNWGDDYFSFWVGGVFFLVLNSQLFFDSSQCPELKEAQDVWLDEQLAVAEKQKCKHIIVFQHIPLFLSTPDEDHGYFNLEKSVREEIMEKFHKAGIKAVFAGHYHRNAGGSYKGLEMVVSSAIGCQLGEDTHGLRVVVVTEEKLVHRYYSLNELSSQGIEKELLDVLAKQK
ncbi:serine/threonine-protein phosphatase CPPED1 isoform X2 [Chiroxiphia lanceolata]|uniref:serine/threonine-protein phosphatase CPPED1 isoform X2 n=1 Tax=Chiroxiphia lanceolata TaxID=296741 RepID=UPI0013CF0B1C|nr:serine/threonine-protein phosphatase CPPED1 isoform X2 [Chiroxiphia lanceolata]